MSLSAMKKARRFALAGCVLAASGCDIRDEAVRPMRNRPLIHAGQRAAEAETNTHTIEYVGGYDAGLKRATAEGKPLLVIFRASWCRFSAKMNQDVLADPRFVALSRRVVCVVLDADRDAATCREFGVSGFPTVMLVLPEVGERFRTTGRPAADTLVAALERAIDPVRVADGEPSAADETIAR